jgi:HEAT repeat protein
VDGPFDFEHASAWLKGLFSLACVLVAALSLIPAVYLYQVQRDRIGDPGNLLPLLIGWGLWFIFGLIPALLLCVLMWLGSAPISLLVCTFLLVWWGPILLSSILCCVIATAFWFVDVPNRWRLRHGRAGPTDEDVERRIRRLERARAVPLLIDALKHADVRSRRGAAEALGQIGAADAVLPLVNALKDGDCMVRSHAAQALGHLRDGRAILSISELLKDGQTDVRRSAARSLGEIRHADAVLPLIDALSDQESTVATEAAAGLAELRDNRAVLPLIETLKHPDAQLRQRAAEALGTIADLRAVSPLFEVLKYASQSSDTGRAEDLVLASAAEALRNIGTSAVLPLIEQALRQSPRMGKLIPDLAHRDVWVEHLGTDAAFADIRKLGLSAVPLLIEALKDEAADARSGAAVGLGILADPRGVLPLVEALKDPEVDVRTSAAEALSKLGHKQA